jgi:hypothetical protein
MSHGRPIAAEVGAAVLTKEADVPPVLLWLLGIPIPLIILLHLIHVV